MAAQLDSVFSDVRIDTTKIGMLAETDIVEAVAERLARYRVANVVLDTVMLAKSGDPLLSASAVETLRQRLLPQVSLITPNLPEAAALLDAPMRAPSARCWSRGGRCWRWAAARY